MGRPDADELYMAQALALAERGRGRTSPNPMVGALVVDPEGVIVGRGVHERAGGPHAEVLALREAGPRARGATLFCTLEPCSHTGRTGPCAPLVAEAGIARAVVATTDPNPLVSGRGLGILRAHGVAVTLGTLGRRAARLNDAFFSVMERGRPLVTMKAALSLDGWLSAAPGARTRLTGPAADRFVHRERAAVDAIGVGAGTLLADDPLLTARGAFRARPLTRVVFDTRLRTPPAARLLSTLNAGPVIIVTSAHSAALTGERARALEDAGARLLAVPTHESPGARPPLGDALAALAAEGVTSIVLEGGAALHESAWRAGLVDRVQVFVSSRALGPGGVPWLRDALFASGVLRDVSVAPLGEDVLLEGHVHRLD